MRLRSVLIFRGYYLVLPVVVILGLHSTHMLHHMSWPNASNISRDDELTRGATESKYKKIPEWQVKLEQSAKHAVVSGPSSGGNKTLVIGISSVYREQNYLNQTLSSLVQQSEESEREDVVVVVFLADSNPLNNQAQLSKIQAEFKPHLESGFIQVITKAPGSPNFYPSMESALAKAKYSDPPERIIWRTRQVIDFGFLVTYAFPLGKYYLILEDDLLAAPLYISAIKDFIRTRKQQNWTSLKFAEFMIIGLLLRSEELPKLLDFLWMFYDNMPVDIIINEYIEHQVPDASVTVVRIPALFQHIGLKSTLAKKVQDIKDWSFGLANREFKHLNPNATFLTTMQIQRDCYPENAYKPYPGFFYAKAKFGDTLQVMFPHPLNTTRIVFFTGIKQNSRMAPSPIVSGDVEVSYERSENVCRDFQLLQPFKNATVDFQGNVTNVQCLRVRIGPDQPEDIIIREIQIFT